MPDLREFLRLLEKRDELVRIKRAVSPRFEIAAILKKVGIGPATLFEEVKGSRIKVVGGVCGTRERIGLAIGANKERLQSAVTEACKNPNKPSIVNDAPVKEVTEKPDLKKLPILTHYENDAGPYITAGVVFARDPDTGIQNASFHRMLLLDKNHLVIRIVPRHLYRIFSVAKKRGRALEIAVAIGLHPLVMLSSATSIPYGQDEMSVANSLMNGELRLTKCENVDVEVPAEAEIVLEGLILPNEEAEEHMTDILGLYDISRKQPVVELASIMHRKEPLYQTILPAGPEHTLLMGLPHEVGIWEGVSKVVPEVKGVNLTMGSGGWLHAIVSITKQSEGDAKNVILASFAAHPSLKMCTVVDEDVDVHSMMDVEWAIMTRMQPDKDVIIIPNARGSSLDPSSDQETLITSKIGIDATATFLKPRAKFDKAKIPGEKEIHLEEY